MQNHEIVYKNMVEIDKAAKAAGELVGRYVRESVADGYAYYTVIAVNGGSAQVEHVPYLDGYRVPMIESMDGCIPLKYVKENIGVRDRWQALFDSQR